MLQTYKKGTTYRISKHTVCFEKLQIHFLAKLIFIEAVGVILNPCKASLAAAD